MMVGEPCVGIVYKKKDGSTYTDWHHQQVNTWKTPPEIWISGALCFAKVSPINWPKPMAVVRSK